MGSLCAYQILVTCLLITVPILGLCDETSELNDTTPVVVSSVDHITLRLVTIIMNEGTSTPPSTYSFIDSQLRPEFWPDGQPQLTETGKSDLFEMGKTLRKRYRDFLTDSPREVYARSSDKDNNIEAALVLLHGTYKAHGRWKYAKTDYLPIPVHTVPTPDDCILNIHCKCPKTLQALTDFFQSPEITQYKKDFEPILKLIETKTRLTSLFQQIDYVETALLQNYLKSPLPSWMSPGVIGDFKDLANEFHSMATADPAILKLMVGSFYAELISKFKAQVSSNTRLSSTTSKPKLLLYSTVTPIMSSVAYDLAGINGYIPHPGTAFMIELYEAPGASFFVKFHYWQSADSKYPEAFNPNFTLSSSPSTSEASLNDLLTHIQSFTEPDWKVFCGLGETADSGLDTLSTVLIIILCCVFASVAFTVIMIVKRSRSGYVIFK